MLSEASHPLLYACVWLLGRVNLQQSWWQNLCNCHLSSKISQPSSTGLQPAGRNGEANRRRHKQSHAATTWRCAAANLSVAPELELEVGSPKPKGKCKPAHVRATAHVAHSARNKTQALPPGLNHRATKLARRQGLRQLAVERQPNTFTLNSKPEWPHPKNN